MIWEAIGGITLVILLLTAAMWAFYRAGRETGYEEGRADAYAEKLAENRAARGRHAMSQPRAEAPAPAPELARVTPEREPWYQVFHATPAAPAATAIDTVLLTPEAAPAKNGAPDTGTMPRVTDTGSIPAITDTFIADMEAREAAHRKELTEREELADAVPSV